MANKERLLKVADAIEKDTLKNTSFDMSTYLQHFSKWKGEGCQTVGCIAGYATLLYNIDGSSRKKSDPPSSDVQYDAEKILELSKEEAEELFLSTVSVYITDKIEKEEAVKVIRHFAETGEIKWDTNVHA